MASTCLPPKKFFASLRIMKFLIFRKMEFQNARIVANWQQKFIKLLILLLTFFAISVFFYLAFGDKLNYAGRKVSKGRELPFILTNGQPPAQVIKN
jgi:hypothetical protein